MKSIGIWILGGLLVSLATPARAETARATLKNEKGETVGMAVLEDTPHGVLISLDLTNVPPGTHAFHIHATGKCEPPFNTAGGHFNPAGRQHGLKNPAGVHAGDLPNLEVPESGKLKAQAFAAHVTLKPGEASLFDADGSSLMIHAAADDYTTDPTGGAGARILCGVIEK